MISDVISEPPAFDGVEPRMLSARELREALETLFDWLGAAEQMPEGRAPGDATVQQVRDTANAMLAERRLRQSDETARKGG